MSGPMLYFAFGSNLHLPQMQARCPACEVVQPALLAGHRLVFRGNSQRWGGGSATILPTPGGRVPGLVYRLSADDLASLDRFEGYPTIYQRRTVSLEAHDGSALQALTYERSAGEVRPPSLRYFHQIWRGYKAFGLDDEPLLAALAEALADDPGPQPGTA